MYFYTENILPEGATLLHISDIVLLDNMSIFFSILAWHQSSYQLKVLKYLLPLLSYGKNVVKNALPEKKTIFPHFLLLVF